MDTVLASQFDKDQAKNLGKIPVRCGFEAEFASSESRSDVRERLSTILDLDPAEVVVSDSYGASHGSAYDKWSIESDSSIPTDPTYPTSVEIVSPILNLDDMLESLESVLNIIQDIGKTAQTKDKSTGLHLTFSIKDLHLGKSKTAFDPLKLYFLLGEHYWAQVFGRENAEYAESYVKHITEGVKSALSHSTLTITNEAVYEFVTKRSGPLAPILGQPGSRYVSLNLEHLGHADSSTDKSRIEFRLPGGEGYEHKFDKIAAVARKFSYALWASCHSNTDEYTEYYAKRLYKFLSGITEEHAKEKRDGEPFKNIYVLSNPGETNSKSLVTLDANPDGTKSRRPLGSIQLDAYGKLQRLDITDPNLVHSLNSLTGAKGATITTDDIVRCIYADAIICQQDTRADLSYNRYVQKYFESLINDTSFKDPLFPEFAAAVKQMVDNGHTAKSFAALISYIVEDRGLTNITPYYEMTSFGNESYLNEFLPALRICLDVMSKDKRTEAYVESTSITFGITPSGTDNLYGRELEIIGYRSDSHSNYAISFTVVISLMCLAGNQADIAKAFLAERLSDRILYRPLPVFDSSVLESVAYRPPRDIDDVAHFIIDSLCDAHFGGKNTVFMVQYLTHCPTQVFAVFARSLSGVLKKHELLGNRAKYIVPVTGIERLDSILAKASEIEQKRIARELKNPETAQRYIDKLFNGDDSYGLHGALLINSSGVDKLLAPTFTEADQGNQSSRRAVHNFIVIFLHRDLSTNSSAFTAILRSSYGTAELFNALCWEGEETPRPTLFGVPKVEALRSLYANASSIRKSAKGVIKKPQSIKDFIRTFQGTCPVDMLIGEDAHRFWSTIFGSNKEAIDCYSVSYLLGLLIMTRGMHVEAAITPCVAYLMRISDNEAGFYVDAHMGITSEIAENAIKSAKLHPDASKAIKAEVDARKSAKNTKMAAYANLKTDFQYSTLTTPSVTWRNVFTAMPKPEGFVAATSAQEALSAYNADFAKYTAEYERWAQSDDYYDVPVYKDGIEVVQFLMWLEADTSLQGEDSLLHQNLETATVNELLDSVQLRDSFMRPFGGSGRYASHNTPDLIFSPSRIDTASPYTLYRALAEESYWVFGYREETNASDLVLAFYNSLISSGQPSRRPRVSGLIGLLNDLEAKVPLDLLYGELAARAFHAMIKNKVFDKIGSVFTDLRWKRSDRWIPNTTQRYPLIDMALLALKKENFTPYDGCKYPWQEVYGIQA